jgi:hypothetical protein
MFPVAAAVLTEVKMRVRIKSFWQRLRASMAFAPVFIWQQALTTVACPFMRADGTEMGVGEDIILLGKNE